MNIPNWIFDECEKLGFCTRTKGGFVKEWNKSLNPAWMIYKLILIDRKRRK